MNSDGWLSVPVGPDAARWMTRGVRRTVLVAVHTVVSGQRLLDVVGLVESDPTIQVVYTCAPDVFHGGVESFMCEIGALTIPWRQTASEQFDLVLAAARGALRELRGPVLVLPHGAGFAKQTSRSQIGSHAGERSVYGLGADHLMWHGRLIPSSIVLSHDGQRELLARQCPEAADVALVAGDPSYDRLRASVGARSDYRAALGGFRGSTTGCRGVDLGPAFAVVPLPGPVESPDTATRSAISSIGGARAWAATGARLVRGRARGRRAAG